MIKLTDLVEGLVSTVDVDTAVEKLQTLEKQLPVTDKRFSYFVSKLQGDDIEVSAHVQDPKTAFEAVVKPIIQRANLLGYYIRGYKVKYDWTNDSPTNYTEAGLKDELQNDYNEDRGLSLYFSAKFGKEVELPKTVYHITNAKYVDKIQKIGLKPTSQAKQSTHPDRVYLAVSPESAVRIGDSLRILSQSTGQDNAYTMLTFDTVKFPDSLKFYKDPHFTDGVYTHGNIPPSAITSVEPFVPYDQRQKTPKRKKPKQ